MGLCAVAVAAYFLFRRRRQQQAANQTAAAELTPGTATSEQAYWPKEAAASPALSEAPPNTRPTELHSPAYTHELDNTHYQELPGDWQGHEMAGRQ